MIERVKDHNLLFLELPSSLEVVYQPLDSMLLIMKTDQKALQIHWAELQDQEVKLNLPTDQTDLDLKLLILKLMKMMNGSPYKSLTLFCIMRSKNNHF
jgi:hypothetical protein